MILNEKQIWILNTSSWPVIQVLVSFFISRIAYEKFDPEHFLYAEKDWEREGKIYEILGVRKWKKMLPDFSRGMGNEFRKRPLEDLGQDELRRFIHETCRSECAHLIMLSFCPVFFIWNPPWAAWIMVFAGLVLNVPCLLTQRYNRIYLKRKLLV